MNTETAYCLLGSNLGDRLEVLRQAAFLLGSTHRIELTRASRVYETAPWGMTDQPAFLNAAVEIKTSLPAEALLHRIHEIEAKLGRRRESEQHWGPRPIDIDIALYGYDVIEHNHLRVPHTRLHERAFALVPLLEIKPDLRDPRNGDRLQDYLDRLGENARTCCADAGSLLLDITELSEADLFPGTSGLYMSRDAEATKRFAEAIGAHMKGGEVVALVGNLGAGKTCFAGGFAQGLGINEPITSPSYVLVKSYESGRLALHHADFYRLAETGTAEPPDLASLGLEDYLDDPAAVVLVEWADRAPSWLEPPFWMIDIALTGLENRLLHVRAIR